MGLYYKQVDAEQFLLTQEQKDSLKAKQPVHFQGYPVKYLHGNVYLVLIPVGEIQLRLYETQWLIREQGAVQIYSAGEFNQKFIKPPKAQPIV